jgi:hypothetical protein
LAYLTATATTTDGTATSTATSDKECVNGSHTVGNLPIA